MTRRLRLSTARRSSSVTSSPSSSSASHSDTTQLLLNNRFSPDIAQLANDLASAFLHLSPEDALCDIILRTADGVEIAANKSVLAVRSQYFRNLFFSRFAEAHADVVTLPLRATPLRHILQYIYTADVPLVRDVVRRLPSSSAPSLSASLRMQQHNAFSNNNNNDNNNSNRTNNTNTTTTTTMMTSMMTTTTTTTFTSRGPDLHHPRLASSPHHQRQQQQQATPPSHAVLQDLIDLSVAADYVHLAPLQRLANDTLSAIVAAYPRTTCTALEAIQSHPNALQFCEKVRIWTEVLRHPRHFFLVPDCLAIPASLTHPQKQQQKRLLQQQQHSQHSQQNQNQQQQQHDPVPQAHYGVLELSAETLENCLRSVAATPVDYEYLFQVVYFWATEGVVLQRRTPPDVSRPSQRMGVRRRGTAAFTKSKAATIGATGATSLRTANRCNASGRGTMQTTSAISAAALASTSTSEFASAAASAGATGPLVSSGPIAAPRMGTSERPVGAPQLGSSARPEMGGGGGGGGGYSSTGEQTVTASAASPTSSSHVSTEAEGEQQQDEEWRGAETNGATNAVSRTSKPMTIPELQPILTRGGCTTQRSASRERQLQQNTRTAPVGGAAAGKGRGGIGGAGSEDKGELERMERLRNSGRWKRAMQVAEQIDLKQMRALFVRDYVEWTGLVSTERLMAVYRFHATRGTSPLGPRTRDSMRIAAKRSRE